MAIPIESIWKIYYYVALFSTIVFVIKLALFATVGGDSEVIADFNSEVDTDCSFNFISVQSVIAFFMGFGWMGYAALKQFELSQWVGFGVAFAVGIVFMFLTAYLMFLVKKLEKKVKKDKTTAVGQVGKAYTKFAPQAIGQVEVEINGQLSVVEAKNDSDEEINAFDLVKVTKVVDEILYIQKENN
jgi:membrane protein implicated in regulation of membrane protease activity